MRRTTIRRARLRAAIADQLRAQLSERCARRRPKAASPNRQAGQAPPRPRLQTAPKSGKRKLVLMGIVALLALAAAGYGVHYFLVGRFYVATDDAYVRANNTTLGARVSGHIAAILPGDNALVHAGDVIFKIDDGDYRIAVDAARTKIATQQATIDRIGRQVTALESAVEQAKAQLASAEAGLEARRSRFRPPAGAEQQGLCLARDLRGVRSRPRPGRRGGEVGAGGL